MIEGRGTKALPPHRCTTCAGETKTKVNEEMAEEKAADAEAHAKPLRLVVASIKAMDNYPTVHQAVTQPSPEEAAKLLAEHNKRMQEKAKHSEKADKEIGTPPGTRQMVQIDFSLAGVPPEREQQPEAEHSPCQEMTPYENEDTVPSIGSNLFSRYIETVRHEQITSQNRAHVYLNKNSVFDDFEGPAVMYATTLIQEVGVKEKDRALQRNTKIGGRCGGKKYQATGCVFLKTPDQSDLYANYVMANKTAKHELRYADLLLTRFMQCQSTDSAIVVAPLPTVCVDFLGRRVVETLLVTEDWVEVVGMSGTEAGVPKYDEAVAAHINKLLEPLGFARHRAYYAPMYITKESETCALPYDTQVYRMPPSTTGDDKKQVCVVVDPTRLCPPVSPRFRSTQRNSALSMHMRPELVRKYYLEHGRGLSGDAYHACSLPGDNKSVHAACEEMLPAAVHRVAEHLSTLDCSTFCDLLGFVVHFHGVNLRYLGDVYDKLADLDSPHARDWQQRIKVEVAARSFRRVADALLRQGAEKRSVLASQTRSVVLQLYNCALSTIDEHGHRKVWERINEWAQSRFPAGMVSGANLESESDDDDYDDYNDDKEDDKEKVESRDTWETVVLSRDDVLVEGKEYLLECFLATTSELLGAPLAPELWARRRNLEYFRDARRLPFDVTLVGSLHPRVVRMNMAEHAQAMALYCTLDCSEENARKIAELFKRALERQPTNPKTIESLARAYNTLARKVAEKRPDEAEQLREREKYLLERGLKVPEVPGYIELAVGLLCAERYYCGDTSAAGECEERLRNAIEKKDQHAPIALADFLYHTGRISASQAADLVKDMTGINGLNHRMVFSILAGRWGDAVVAAEAIKAKEHVKAEDKYAVDQADRFLEWLHQAAQCTK